MNFIRKILTFILTLLFLYSNSQLNYYRSYKLDKSVAKVTVTAGVNDDHGNSRDSATPVNLNAVVSGSMESPGDSDYFKINVVKKGILEVFTKGNTDTYGTFEDNNGNIIGEDDDSGESKNFIISQMIQPGAYYIKVRDYYPDLCGSYDLYTNFSEITDDYGNDIASATEITVNKIFSGNIQYSQDIDFFKIKIEQSGMLEVFSEGATDTYGTIYNITGKPIIENDDDGPEKNFIMTIQVEPGTYYISVRHYYPDLTGQYTLTAKLKPLQKDDYGNSFIEAALLENGVQKTGGIQMPGDVDYFKFTVTSDSDLELYSEGSTDTYGSIYNETKTLIVQNDDDGSDKNFLITTRLSPGVYYLEVKDFYVDRVGDYSLFLRLTGGESTIVSLNPGDSNTCAFEYDGHRYAYIGCNISPARIVKFDLQEMRRVSAIDLPANENRDECRVSALISISPDTIIHASFTNPCVFTKINVNTMQISGTLVGEVENTNDKFIRTMVYDGKYVYAATYSDPGKIIKFDPVTMTRIDSVTFPNGLVSCIFKITIIGDYIVGVCDRDTDENSKIFKIKKDDLHGTFESFYIPGKSSYHSICNDGRYVYAATDSNPISIVKIDPLAPQMTCIGIYNGIKDVEAGNFSITYDGTNVIAGTWNFTNRDKLIKINPANMEKREERIFLPSFPADLTYIEPYLYTCTDNATGNVVRLIFK